MPWALAIAWKGLTTFVRFNDALPSLVAVAAELHPNGGESVKDHVSASTASFELHVEDDRAAFERIEARLP